MKIDELQEAIKMGKKPKTEIKIKRELLQARDYKVSLDVLNVTGMLKIGGSRFEDWKVSRNQQSNSFFRVRRILLRCVRLCYERLDQLS